MGLKQIRSCKDISTAFKALREESRTQMPCSVSYLQTRVITIKGALFGY